MIINLLLAYALGALTALALTSRAVARKEEKLREGAAELTEMLEAARVETAAIKRAQTATEEQADTLVRRLSQIEKMGARATQYLGQAVLRKAMVGLETATTPEEVGEVLRTAREATPPGAGSIVVALRYAFVYLDADLLLRCRSGLLYLRDAEELRRDHSTEEWMVVWDRWLDAHDELRDQRRKERLEERLEEDLDTYRYWECRVCGADLRDKPGSVCAGCKKYELDSDY